MALAEEGLFLLCRQLGPEGVHADATARQQNREQFHEQF
jgi:hypothetical protein